MQMTLGSRLVAGTLALAALAMAPAPEARAAEISVLVGGASPDTTWGTCWGGLLTITLFNIVHGEVEGAHQGGALECTSLYTASAKAYLGPSFGLYGRNRNCRWYSTA